MKEIFTNLRTTLKEIGREGRRTFLWIQLFLISLALLDGISLILLTEAFSNNNFQSADKIPLLALAVLLFILKSLLAPTFTLLALRRVEKMEIALAKKNLRYFLNLDWLKKRRVDSTKLFNLVVSGPHTAISDLLFSAAQFLTEAATILTIFLVLVWSNPFVSLIIGTYFMSMVLIQDLVLGRISSAIGSRRFKKWNHVHGRIADISNIAKLLAISPSSFIQKDTEDAAAEQIFLRNRQVFVSSMPRYLMEGVLAGGLVLIAIVTYYFFGPSEIIPVLAVFCVAGLRILPSFNRMQTYLLNARGNLPMISSAFPVYNHKDNSITSDTSDQEDILPASDCIISLHDVQFRFEDAPENILRDINLELKPGKRYALVGPSGAGKSTLIDLILGLYKPTAGLIARKKDLMVSYVPQETFLIRGSLESNVTFSESTADQEDRRYLDSIKLAQLDFLPQLNDSDAEKLELSGGQKQRVGIARAIYQDCDLLVLDEATSALDNQTEKMVVDAINSTLRADMTLLVVAHRLSTIRELDEIIYLENGVVLGIGSWVELFETLPEFRNQVSLGDLK